MNKQIDDQAPSVPPLPLDTAPTEALQLHIEPVVERARSITESIATQLPGHPGLIRASRGVVSVALEAERVSQRLRRIIGLHRVPALFLLLSVITIALTVYLKFFHVSVLRVAVSARDAVELRSHLVDRVRFKTLDTEGSSVSVRMLQEGRADVAFVQGGVDLPAPTSDVTWLTKRLESSEIVMFYLRRGCRLLDVRRVLTSSKDQGSHTLAQKFFDIWHLSDQVSYLHDWRQMTDDDDYLIPEDVDAIFVVKDPRNRKLQNMAGRLHEAGFQVASPDIGANAALFPFLEQLDIRAGFLDPALHIPPQPIASYRVDSYVVTSSGLTPRQLAAAEELASADEDSLTARGFEPTFSDASDFMQGIEAGLGILAYIGIAFLALLGLDVLAYRKRFNELNSLISLISMHQSDKDAVGGTAENRAHNVLYLSFCSDLLGLISVITGYYTQENSSLMYNRLLDVIHERSSGLKLNIQLKILHSQIQLPDPVSPTQSPSSPATQETGDTAQKNPDAAGPRGAEDSSYIRGQ